MKRLRIDQKIIILLQADYDALCREVDRLREVERLVLVEAATRRRQEATTRKLTVLADHTPTEALPIIRSAPQQAQRGR